MGLWLTGLAAALAALVASAAAPTKYLCVGSGSSVPPLERGQSSQPERDPSERWVLEEVIAKVDGAVWSAGQQIWQLSREGSQGIKTLCSDWSQTADTAQVRGDTILCRGVYEFVLNKTNLLFVLTYSQGYVVDKCSVHPDVT